jgi:hypothetical protein
VAGFIKRKREFEKVLEDYGYNGATYPKKEWICTETTIPRKKFTDNLGSELAQTNYIIKSLVAAQKDGLHQYHIYTMADSKKLADAKGEYDLMGLFYNLENVQPYQHTPTVAGIAYKTTSDLLFGWRYDPDETAKLKLPNTADGGAFRNDSGEITYVLWAKTTKDENELISTTLTFPKHLKFKTLDRMEWDYSTTKEVKQVAPLYLKLTGAPSFFRRSKTLNPLSKGLELTTDKDLQPYLSFKEKNLIQLYLPQAGALSLRAINPKGTLINTLIKEQYLDKGNHLIKVDFEESGVFIFQIELDDVKVIQKVVAPQ